MHVNHGAKCHDVGIHLKDGVVTSPCETNLLMQIMGTVMAVAYYCCLKYGRWGGGHKANLLRGVGK